MVSSTGSTTYLCHWYIKDAILFWCADSACSPSRASWGEVCVAVCCLPTGLAGTYTRGAHQLSGKSELANDRQQVKYNNLEYIGTLPVYPFSLNITWAHLFLLECTLITGRKDLCAENIILYTCRGTGCARQHGGVVVVGLRFWGVELRSTKKIKSVAVAVSNRNSSVCWWWLQRQKKETYVFYFSLLSRSPWWWYTES